MPKKYYADRRLYWTKDGEITDDPLQGKQLYVSVNKEIPEEVYERFSGRVVDDEEKEADEGENKEAVVDEDKGRIFPTPERSKAEKPRLFARKKK